MSKISARNLDSTNFSYMLGGLEKLPSHNELSLLEPPSSKTQELLVRGEFALQRPEDNYHDFDLAEFPWAIFERTQRVKNGKPIVYEDTIRNSDTDEIITRRFETFPCPEHGHATHSTYELAYLLIQIYIGDDEFDDRVRFGSLANLCRMKGVKATSKNRKTIKKDLKILSGMKINSEKAFWDSEKKSYVDMLGWRFFGAAAIYEPKNTSPMQEEMDFSYIEVSPTFQKIASTRGLFGLGFSQQLFFSLSPLQQRLAVYLARRFKFQSFVKHDVDRVCSAIPITDKQSSKRKDKLKEITDGLLEKGFPLLHEYTIEKKNRVWKVNFKRKKKPTPEKPFWTPKDFLSMTPEEECLVNDMIELTGDSGAKRWFVLCLRKLGESQVYRAMSIFKETYVHGDQKIKNTKGAVMTGILQIIGKELGIDLRKH